MWIHWVIICIVLSVSPLSGMEPVESGAPKDHNSCEDNFSGSELGGAVQTTQALSTIAVQDVYYELWELRLLMRAVVDGIVVKDHAVLLPGRAVTVPLARAGQWVNDVLNDAFEKEDKGEVIVQSTDPFLRECEIAQKRLWDFVLCADLLESGSDNIEYKHMLQNNRMLRIGALFNQDEALLAECGRAPVFLNVHTQWQLYDFHAQFDASRQLLMDGNVSNSQKRIGCLGFLSQCMRKKKYT